MIVFKKIKWKNFLSTGNQFINIDLNKSASTLVIGENGSGKSTLLDALCFVLFNRPFRYIKKEQIINSINEKDCVTEVIFSVGKKDFKIRRGIKPNFFEIYCNNVLLNQDASNVDYQKHLEQNILKLNYRSFVQVVILGSSSYEPFMRLRARYRREVVEEILDIKVFTQMALLLRLKNQELTKNVQEIKHKCDLLDEKYNLEKKHFETIKNKNENILSDKEHLLKQNEEDIEKYNSKLSEIDKELGYLKTSISDKLDVDEKVNKLQILEAKLETNILNHKTNLQTLQESDICPTCGQDIKQDVREIKIAERNAKILKLETGLKDLISETLKAEQRVNKIGSVSEKISDLELNIAKINTSIDEINRFSNKVKIEIDEIKTNGVSSTDVYTSLDKLKQDLEDTKIQRDEIVEEKAIVDIAREIVNDTGAKTKIIEKYLPIMNQLINEYLQNMDFFINFELNDEFIETIKSRYRDDFSYNNFSEGEKMRIDLALLFTWRAVAKLKNSTNTNILILDEIFDSSLDGEGTESFFKILNRNLQNENTFIISHKGDILFDKFTNTIKFQKHKNFARLV
tara:strand:+ start:1019 stop:2731 length:1713 start_codon:yes stop_codon:yes gene_type:complete